MARLKRDLVEPILEYLLSSQKDFPFPYLVQKLHVFLKEDPFIHQEPDF